MGSKLYREHWFNMLAILIMLTVTSFNLFAREIKIGVVNTEKILRESAPALLAQKKIEKEFQAYDERIKKMAAEIQLLQNQLEQNDQNLTVEERRVKERELAHLSRQYQRAQQQMREDLSMRQNEEYSLILEQVNKTIKHIAEKEDYDLILQLQDSVYRSQRIDITNQVIKAMGEPSQATGK
ncbi:periplasmic chaperone for outer membrane proteins Skp [Nitrosomonas nitrosa]|uniref:Outer membrane protein n=1 Tax=Nitrosomonas nitrosa TaxID=52442 RepID=A0A1I4P7K6_9PROT|nr:OmpH family outer membrane protein [Nitrosomonas nitrosa]PTQ97105.1 periplasmic chaperone for outer membrane proteins Skp [Nitrosomonas nitrosa]CAE6509891.1 Outer membrane protein [Nitrosomonas nitrosa]SFM23771.1 periplasmic chaperone for outer membrane proteins Skp [Nitrosomonas nitrosa]HNP51131.1 OmpH family outer membrane protein [Nitrosomonas nitrosa]